MKKIKLSVEEWTRIEAVPLEGKRKALKKLARYVHGQIAKRGFTTGYGPFSFAAMGGNAIVIICSECCDAIFYGEWHWKPELSLLEQLKKIAYSKIGHIIKEYYDKGKPEMMLTSEQSFCREVEMSLANQLEREANLREMGYEMARDAVKDHPMMLAYLDALYAENDYRGMAKRLKMTKNEVKALEKELIDFLEKI